VLGITGYAAEAVRGELQAAGFCEVIHKPFEIDTLAQVVRRVLDEENKCTSAA
jgi:CheY-like chemotaxis protein